MQEQVPLILSVLNEQILCVDVLLEVILANILGFFPSQGK